MSKNIAIVYWTGTGNTEEMAHALEAGIAAAGAEARVVPVADFSAEDVPNYDALAFGCPAMGAEELESDEFELFEAPQCLVHVPVDLPASARPRPLAPVRHEAVNVLDGVAEDKADLMGKGGPVVVVGAQATPELSHERPASGGEVVLGEKLVRLRAGEKTPDAARAPDEQHRSPFSPSQQGDAHAEAPEVQRVGPYEGLYVEAAYGRRVSGIVGRHPEAKDCGRLASREHDARLTDETAHEPRLKTLVKRGVAGVNGKTDVHPLTHTPPIVSHY